MPSVAFMPTNQASKALRELALLFPSCAEEFLSVLPPQCFIYDRFFSSFQQVDSEG